MAAVSLKVIAIIGLVCVTLSLDHLDCVGFLRYVGDLKELWNPNR